MGGRYLEYIYLTKDLYPEYIKNSYNSIPIKKMDLRFELHRRKHEWPINP